MHWFRICIFTCVCICVCIFTSTSSNVSQINPSKYQILLIYTFFGIQFPGLKIICVPKNISCTYSRIAFAHNLFLFWHYQQILESLNFFQKAMLFQKREPNSTRSEIITNSCNSFCETILQNEASKRQDATNSPEPFGNKCLILKWGILL